MLKCEKTILHELLDKFEKSKSFIGSNKVNQTFSIKPVNLFPKYEDEAEYDVYCEINEAIASLEEKGFIVVKRQKSGVVTQITLNLNKVDEVYVSIKRVPKKDTNKKLADLLLKYQNNNKILSLYCTEQLRRLSENKKVEFFDVDFTVFENLLKVISAVPSIHEEIYERDFSIQTLGDSKSFELIKSKVISLLYEYGDFSSKETVLSDSNIVKNPGHVYFKGNGRIFLCGQTIDLSNMGGDIAISSNLLDSIEEIQVKGSSVVTIENLTSFNRFCCKDSFAIYLGGYHNTLRKKFIVKLYSQNQDKKYLHYGDIDAGGFYILRHLKNDTNVPFIPYLMNISVLKDNIQYTKKLTDNDKRRLSNLLNSEYSDVINFMLENNCKLEQEALDLQEVGL